MFLVDEGRFSHVTATFADWFDVTTEALVGRPIEEVLATEYVDHVEAALAHLEASDGLASTVCRCRVVSDGEELPVTLELVSFPGDTAIVGFARAEATLGQARNELETARDRFGHLFDLIQDAVVEVEIVDMVPVVRSVNPAFVDVFGYDAGTVVGESLNEFIVPADGGRQAADFDKRTARGHVNYATVTRQTANGSREFLYRGIPYDRDDDRQFGFAIYTDVTEQRRLQRHLQVLNRVLRHNLRNELTIVMGIAASLRETVDDAHLRSQIDLIHDHAAVLDDVSEKAHTVASLLEETDATTTLPVEPLVSEVVGRCRERYPRATITTRIDPEVEVTTNPALGAAIEELVENGVEHNEGDPTVHVETERRDGEIRLTVADDGPGIPSADRAVVFDDGDITDLQHGSGLGLWLVRWVTEAAGGHVVHERRDDWTAVTLHLCRADGDAEAAVSPGSLPQGNATD
jgi:PAS domain S-box-containing protein